MLTAVACPGLRGKVAFLTVGGWNPLSASTFTSLNGGRNRRLHKDDQAQLVALKRAVWIRSWLLPRTAAAGVSAGQMPQRLLQPRLRLPGRAEHRPKAGDSCSGIGTARGGPFEAFLGAAGTVHGDCGQSASLKASSSCRVLSAKSASVSCEVLLCGDDKNLINFIFDQQPFSTKFKQIQAQLNRFRLIISFLLKQFTLLYVYRWSALFCSELRRF